MAQLVQIRHHRDTRESTDTGFSPLKLLLPVDYPVSVRPEYARYAGWQFVASICGSAASVFGTQALFCAAGMDVSAPLAASTAWVLKDGIGQFGGIMFSSVVGTRFDTNPRLWIFVSAAVLDASVVLEMIAPMAPSAFLMLASVSNGLKNVSFLAASASRATIHSHLALGKNLADVTVKKGSQNIVSSMIGMGTGIALTSVVGLESFVAMALCAGHLIGTHLSVSKITV
ncbi:root UVB sensitive family [Tribonema minus]|uniref:Root UVB sensitive family n=1 Tax=Tribonema minus TaxID=303371 RepID=A0A835Z4M0_9STRA|nr:root UVB sensitive family [Tribonema minus]KAG5186358.1 root UVB sensitive family [Tribonema minus]